MANNVMSDNNKKGKGKAGKHSDINSFYGSKPTVSDSASAAVETAQTAQTAQTAPIAVPIAVQPAAAPAHNTPAPGSPQTIRNPSDESKWKRVAKKADSVDAPTTPPQAATPTEEPAPAAVSNIVPEVVAERQASIREGPPPTCHLDDNSSEQKQMVEAMRDVIANQQRMLEMMQSQLRISQAPPAFPFMMQHPMQHMASVMSAMPAMPMPAMSMPAMQAMPTEYPNWVHQQAVPTPSAFISIPGTGARAAAAVAIPATEDVKQHKKPDAKPHHNYHKKAEKAQAKDEDEEDDDVEFAPFQLRLNDECPANFNCPNSKKPHLCPKNHHKLGNFIKKGAKLPKFFCKWDRPWKKGPNGKPLRCRNQDCFFAHLEGRADFLKKASSDASHHAE